MNLDSETIKKIEIIDQLLSCLDYEDLKQLSEREEIVIKLKGIDKKEKIIYSLIREIENCQFNLEAMKRDLSIIIRRLNLDYLQSHTDEFLNLKNKYQVY